MPSINDVFQELQTANANLQQLLTCCGTTNQNLTQLQGCCQATNQGLGAILITLNAGFANLSQGFQAIITLQTYANTALAINAEQNRTIICALEKISEQTCSLLNEAHTQTGLQTSIEESSTTLRELYKSTHADAAVLLERDKKLRKQIEKCCPPEEPEPVCTYAPCPTPSDLGTPPSADYKPFEPAVRD